MITTSLVKWVVKSDATTITDHIQKCPQIPGWFKFPKHSSHPERSPLHDRPFVLFIYFHPEHA